LVAPLCFMLKLERLGMAMGDARRV